MSSVIASLLEKDQLNSACRALSISELETLQTNLQALLHERRECDQQRELERKGQRVLDDMRGLMARAGISMDELQAALSDR